MNNISEGQKTFGIFEGHRDIGAGNQKGKLEYHPGGQIYFLGGLSENIRFDEDRFHFTWTRLPGDFIIEDRFYKQFREDAALYYMKRLDSHDQLQ